MFKANHCYVFSHITQISMQCNYVYNQEEGWKYSYLKSQSLNANNHL
jgi:hypothetical protein